MKLKHGQHILFWNLGWCLGSTVSPYGSMFLATLLYWYTCSGSPHHVASGVQSWGAPRHGTNKCTTTGGSLRTYCSIPYTGLGSHSSHSRLSPVWFQGWISLNLKGSRIVIVNSKSARWDITGVYALVVVVAKCPLPSQLSQLQLLAASQQKPLCYSAFLQLEQHLRQYIEIGVHSISKGSSRICFLV